jgi:hypothetical protein
MARRSFIRAETGDQGRRMKDEGSRIRVRIDHGAIVVSIVVRG